MSLPAALRFTGLQLTSLITGIMAVVLGTVFLGTVYFGPEEFIRRSSPIGQTSIAVYVESLGPVWPALFITMGVGLILSITARRGVIVAHVLAVFGWMFYGSALLIWAILSEPPTPIVNTGVVAIVTGVVAIGVAGIHFGLIQAHQEAGNTSARLGGLL